MKEARKQTDDANRNCQDMEVQKKKIALQKAEVEKQYQEAEEQLQSMEKIKDGLKKEVEDTRTMLAHEAQVNDCLFNSKISNIFSLSYLSTGTSCYFDKVQES